MSIIVLLCAVLSLLGAFPTSLGCWTAEYNSKHVITVTNVQTDENNDCINEMSTWNVSVTILQLYECITINDSTTILFESGEFTLNSRIELNGVHDIALIGCPNKSKIICSQSEPTGLKVIGVRGLKIVDLVLEHCGAVYNSTTLNTTTNVYITLQSSIYISYSTDVIVESVSVENSTGNAVTFIDTNGSVTIKYSQFKWSTLPETQRSISAGGSGVYVEFTYNHTAKDNKYKFKSCKFIGNKVSIPDQTRRSNHLPYSYFNGLNRGGGLCIFIRGNATNNSILILDTTFHNNSAERGGGLYLSFRDSPHNNHVFINNSDFYHNYGDLNSGGVSVGYIFLKKYPPEENKINFHNCNFTANQAKYGGGITIYSSKSEHYRKELKNDFEFHNCIWMYNKAQYGSAVGIVPSSWDTLSYGLLPIPLFEDCQFKSNEVLPYYDNSQPYIKYITGKGTFSASQFYVRFKGNIVFDNNNGSAVYLTSSILELSRGTNVTFADNSGSDGGAMAVIGFSSVHVQEHSTLLFRNNTATERGGAIFSYSIDKHDDVSAHSCFIQYTGNDRIPIEERNVRFTFEDNKAGESRYTMPMEALQPIGHSIFATSLEPCFYACLESEKLHLNVGISTAFSCIGNFTYEGNEHEISSDGKMFKLENCTLPLKVIPGKEFELPVSIEDDFKQKVRSVYHATVENSKDSCIKIDKAYSYLYDKRIKIFGKPNDEGRLKLFKKGFREFVMEFEIEMVDCPPGFIIYKERKDFHVVLNKCICATETESTYEGLVKCNYTLFRAYIRRHYWIGYDSTETESGLMASYCPISFCLHDKSRKILIPLPGRASKKKLDDIICGPTRTGILCAKCRDGYSTYYHSAPRYKCGKNDHCRMGMLYYILSELLPLTLLFLTVMIFNISFTSGAANSFIFFAQVLNSLSITAEGVIQLQKELERTFRFLYYLFNFDFFGISEFSFCLWKGATTLDILAFKYVTVVYALVLVIATIVVMNVCNCYRTCSCLKPQSVKSSVIHGLSAFLIMCYTQCALVSFHILGPTSLYSQGHKYNRTVVYRYGEMVYFSKNHLPYAMPAIFCLIIIVGLPTISLLVYPAHYKVLALLGLKENSRISRWMTITKMKPLFDSFQSCYRDNCRFYAGLYFVYRLIILGAKVFIKSNSAFYITVEIMLILMISIHALIQPYRKRWHNTLDILIFTDLAIINGLTLYHYIRESYTFTQEESINVTLYIQITLIYLPMIYMIVYVSVQLAKRFLFPRIRIYLQKRRSTDQQHPDDNEFPARLIYNDAYFRFTH